MHSLEIFLPQKFCTGAMLNFSDNTKIGILLVSLGFLFLLLGVLLFLDSGLMAIGNLCLLIGFPCILGFARTLKFFNPIRRKDKARGIICFFVGILMVLIGWPLIGIVLEFFGLIEMFAPFLGIVVQFLRSVPYVGKFFSLPVVASVVDRLAGSAARRRAPV